MLLVLRVGVNVDVLAGGVGADLCVFDVGGDLDVLGVVLAALSSFCPSCRASPFLLILAAAIVITTGSLGAILSPSLSNFSCSRCTSSCFSRSLFCWIALFTSFASSPSLATS